MSMCEWQCCLENQKQKEIQINIRNQSKQFYQQFIKKKKLKKLRCFSQVEQSDSKKQKQLTFRQLIQNNQNKDLTFISTKDYSNNFSRKYSKNSKNIKLLHQSTFSKQELQNKQKYIRKLQFRLKDLQKKIQQQYSPICLKYNFLLQQYKRRVQEIEDLKLKYKTLEDLVKCINK